MARNEDEAQVIPAPAAIGWGVLVAGIVVGGAWLAWGPWLPAGVPRSWGTPAVQVFFPAVLAAALVAALATTLALDARVLRKWRDQGLRMAPHTWWSAAYEHHRRQAHTQHVKLIEHLKEAANSYSREVRRRWFKYWVLLYALPVVAFLVFLLLLAVGTTAANADRPAGVPSWSEVYPGLGIVSLGLLVVSIALLFVARIADGAYADWREAAVQQAAADLGPSKPIETERATAANAASDRAESSWSTEEEAPPDQDQDEVKTATREPQPKDNEPIREPEPEPPTPTYRPKDPLQEFNF